MERLKSIVLMIKSIFLTFIARYRKVDGDLIADKVTGELGSWRFIVTQTVILLAWISLNVYLMHDHFKAWDPYPFILLNLMLSFQAAFTGPIVLMSQNRQGKKDREAIVDSVGDVMVCLINYCVLQDINLVQCMEIAYDQIKNRKGILLPNGVFQKEP
jgi:hypothetical protein